MNILISGASGLIGSSLLWELSSKNHLVRTLVRQAPKPSEIWWDPLHKGPDPGQMEGIDAVVHLAGESISSGRWNESKKKAIRDSRSTGTRLVSEALANMKIPPKVFISASAIGFYGDRGTNIMREDNQAGSGFLPRVCQSWEAATEPAEKAGIRTVRLRFGIVMSPREGALASMLVPFKLGLGGVVGSGEQFMSWVTLDDAVGIITYALFNDPIRGSVNAVSPHPVTYREFAQTLGRVLRRPTFFPLPSSVARLVFGEMATELLLASTRVEPAYLKRVGYQFRYPELEGALRHLLNK